MVPKFWVSSFHYVHECDLLGPKTKEVSKRGGEKNTTTIIQAIVGFKLLCKGVEGEREKESSMFFPNTWIFPLMILLFYLTDCSFYSKTGTPLTRRDWNSHYTATHGRMFSTPSDDIFSLLEQLQPAFN